MSEKFDEMEKEAGKLIEQAIFCMATSGIPPADKALAQLTEALPAIVEKLVSLDWIRT